MRTECVERHLVKLGAGGMLLYQGHVYLRAVQIPKGSPGIWAALCSFDFGAECLIRLGFLQQPLKLSICPVYYGQPSGAVVLFQLDSHDFLL